MMESSTHNFSALTTDLYEVTMAYGYCKAGVAEHEAVFHVTFRELLLWQPRRRSYT